MHLQLCIKLVKYCIARQAYRQVHDVWKSHQIQANSLKNLADCHDEHKILARRTESTVLPKFLPHPEFVAGLDLETQLMRQHAHLAAMVRIMQNHVRKHGRAPGPRLGPTIPNELPDANRPSQGFGQHLRAAFGAFHQRGTDLTLRAAGSIKLRGQLEMRRGKPQPLPANVVHMRKDRRDGAHVSAGRFCPPGAGMQTLDDKLIHLVVYGVGFQQRLAKIRSGQGSGTSHGFPSFLFSGIEPNAELCPKRVAAKDLHAAFVAECKPMVLEEKEVWLGGLDSNQDSQIQSSPKIS
jgi:hypothetical protein